MNRLDPRRKLLLAGAILVVLAAAAGWTAGGAVTGARAALGVTGAAVCLVWWRKRARMPGAPAPIPRLAVVERAGLSPRCSVALVRADGREYLIAFGDGYAQIHPTPSAPVRFGRRPPRRRTSRRTGVRP